MFSKEIPNANVISSFKLPILFVHHLEVYMGLSLTTLLWSSSLHACLKSAVTGTARDIPLP